MMKRNRYRRNEYREAGKHSFGYVREGRKLLDFGALYRFQQDCRLHKLYKEWNAYLTDHTMLWDGDVNDEF